ncbi:MAG: lytic transglycosylase domain-containing protein, partial [Proteobacteria bacterium]|nr:lytic transglycosylase domain-containing protein [Pseudomonadota bacterium]
MTGKISPLILLLAAGLSVPAGAQQNGVTVLRGESEQQTRPGVPDTGVRRIPSTGGGGAPAATPRPSAETTVPIRDGSGGSVLPAPPAGPIGQAIVSGKTLSDAEAAALASALKAIDEGRFADASAAVGNFNNPLLTRLVQWQALRVAPKTEARFQDYADLLRDTPDWPEPEVLRRQAEDRIGTTTPPAVAWRYFADHPPLTSAGHLRRLEAAQAVAPKDVARLAGDSWRTATFRPADEEEFLNKYGTYLTADDQIARFDRIMRENRPQVAKDLVSKLPPAYQPVANARLAMATKAADTVQILRGVAPAQLETPTVRLERLQWMRRSGHLNDAKALLTAPASKHVDGTSEMRWWNERQQVARDLLAAGHAADAYAVIVQHGSTRGLAFAEAEFLAGWIALRHLKKPADGRKHFQTLYDGVSTDISKSRAAYWMGRALEAEGKAKDANEWYGRAAGFGQTFYGQLAARKLPGGAARLPSDPAVNDADRLALGGRELVTVARWLGQASAWDRTQPFLVKLGRLVKGPGETRLLTQLATELKRPDIGVAIARRAVEHGVTLFDASFPVVDVGSTGSIERALALALTRQESAFNAAAVSPSGALGLMQLMP